MQHIKNTYVNVTNNLVSNLSSHFVSNLTNILLLITISISLSGCGFHLRGKGGEYKLPFDTVYLDCNNVAICPNLQSVIKNQSLAELASSPTSLNITNTEKNTPDTKPINKDTHITNSGTNVGNTNNKTPLLITTIKLVNEQTSRDPQNFNSVGRIASYILTYQVQAQVFQHDVQIGNTINISVQSVMQYNDSIILASSFDEASFWDKLHEDATNQLIRRLIAIKPTTKL